MERGLQRQHSSKSLRRFRGAMAPLWERGAPASCSCVLTPSSVVLSFALLYKCLLWVTPWSDISSQPTGRASVRSLSAGRPVTITFELSVRGVSPSELELWARSSPVTFPNYWEIHPDAIYPIPQLNGANFDYLRVPHLNVGAFVAPHLSEMLTIPSNPAPLLDSQLAGQFLAQDRLFDVDLSTPVPTMRGRTPARETSAARHHSAGRTPGAASSNQVDLGI